MGKNLILTGVAGLLGSNIAAVGFHAAIELETKDGSIIGLDGKLVKK